MAIYMRIHEREREREREKLEECNKMQGWCYEINTFTIRCDVSMTSYMLIDVH